MNYDLAIAYRIYPGVSKQPLIYRNDKLKLAELGVASLKLSLNGLFAKVFFILDNCPDEYEIMVKKHFPQPHTEIISLSGEGNAATFLRQIDILLQQTDSDLIYFAEDDYIYRPDEFIHAVNFIKTNPDTAHFVSLYDHMHYYASALHNNSQYLIKEGSGYHWRQAATTCLTFLTTKKMLLKTQTVFRSYARGNFDGSVWLALTKFHIFNPLFFIRNIANKELITIFTKVWYYTFGYVLFSPKRVLWVSLPAIATHNQFDELSPNIEWFAVAKSVEEYIKTTKEEYVIE